MLTNEYLKRVYEQVEKRDAHEPEFLQAVREVFESLELVIDKHPEWEKAALLERFVEPERVIEFRVPWVDDKGEIHVNMLLEKRMKSRCTLKKNSDFRRLYAKGKSAVNPYMVVYCRRS